MKHDIKKAIDAFQEYIESNEGIGTQRIFHREVGDLLLASGVPLKELEWFFGDYLSERKKWDKV